MNGLGVRLLLFGLAILGSSSNGAVFTPAEWERQTWQTENGLPQNTVHAVLQSASGYVWVATEGGLARFDGYRFQVYSTETTPALPSNDVRALANDRRGAIWAATAGGLVRMLGNQLKVYGRESGLPSLNITSVYTDGGGQVVAETSGGDAVWDELRFRAASGRGNPAANATSAIRFADDDPLTRAGILSQMVDREGDIWIGTETAGLTVLRRARFTVFGQRQGLSEDSVRCVLQSRNGSVWIGTDRNGLNRWRDGVLSHVGVSEGLSSDVVISLGENAAGDLLVGTPDGLNVIRNGRVSVLTSADGLSDDLVRSVSNDAKCVYLGGRRGLTVLGEGDFRTYTEADGLGSNLVGATLPAQDALWIATLHGLSVLRDRRLKNYTVRDGLTSDTITALHQDRRGNLWIGTAGGSLNCFRNGRFEHFSAAANLPAVIYGVSEDDVGNLWLSASTGVYRVGRDQLLNGSGEAVPYGTADGLRINECSGSGHPSLWKTRDRSLWFATPRGIAVMTEKQARVNSVPPPVVIESVRIDDDDVTPSSLLAVSPGHSRFTFEYAGLSFAAPQKVRYRYCLEGFDKTWTEAGNRRAAFYTNLPPGNYRFRVIARNNDGIWNTEGAVLSLRLQPHFYQTRTFLLSCLAATALLIYAGYRWRVRQVALRYNAVMAERSRIAREIHDTLAQGFAGVSVQLELIGKLLDLSTEKAREQILEARHLVRSSLNEARRSIWELRSDPDQMQNFAARLSSLTHRAPGEDSAPVRFTVHGDLRPLPPKLEDEWVRIAEEAVRNARQHGHAREIEVVLTFSGKLVRLSVSDNGSGFDLHERKSAREGHFGVDGMRERAESVGARFQMESNPGHGTAVIVEADA